MNENKNYNFLQEIEQTREEKYAMYMKLSKKELIELLINSDEMIRHLIKSNNYTNTIKLKCDGCGCEPNVIYNTLNGKYCSTCFTINTKHYLY